MIIRLILIAFFLLGTNLCFADYYIFNEENRCVGRTSYSPDEEDLLSRNEFSFYSTKDISVLEAEYFNKDVRIRAKSQEEKNAEKVKKDEEDEMKKIYHIMYELAYKESVKRGIEFEHQNDHIDDINKINKIIEEEKLVEKRVIDEKVAELKSEGKTFEHLDK